MTRFEDSDIEAYYKAHPELRPANLLEKLTCEGQYSVPKAPAGNKYHVAPKDERTYNGVLYDSKKEATEAQKQDLRIRANEIDFWLYHVRFPLPNGEIFESDLMTFKFLTEEFHLGQRVSLWLIEVIEVKGYWTREAKRKMKLFTTMYPYLKVTVV